MRLIKDIASRYFMPSSYNLCRCKAGHYYCLNCAVCRADYPDKWNKDIADEVVKDNNLSRCIDYTNLRPDAQTSDIIKLCAEATENNYYAVCVNPVYVISCSSKLSGSDIKVCSVIGFPLGATLTSIKESEARESIANKADELDMVINIGYLKERKIDKLSSEIRSIARICNNSMVTLKCIIETCLLTEEEKIIAALSVKKAGADFVKTSTGFGNKGATKEDVFLLRQVVGSKLGVKASGGIGTKDKAYEMLAAGATRIGTSKKL